jgi:hypothetical protein
MKKKNKQVLIIISCMVLFIACTKEFIVKDIKNKTVTIIAPSDNLTTPNNSVTFWWEELEGAEKYNLQIVKPSFSSVIQLITDTTVTSNKFTKVLTPGAYQWRIKAINAGGSTVYTTRTLIIDTTSNLSFITLNPVTPIGLLTASKVVTFSWTPHPAANYYELNILNSSGASVFTENNINTSSFTHTFTTTTDLKYSWQVKAHNSFSFSQYNTASTFTVDVTAPVSAQITHPSVNGATISGTLDSLMWTRDPSATCDSVVISLDSNFAVSPNYAARTYRNKLKLNSIGLSASQSGNNYYWLRVISIDSVRNFSSPNSKFKFKTN